ncbi:hypothetical protein C8R43DRAFT_957988 [Mycena crocata]|nr:hypothetical protein C8R43DRAFT_957988 [Mycena crocata]
MTSGVGIGIRLPYDSFWVNNKAFLAQRGYVIHQEYDLSWRPADERERQQAEFGRSPHRGANNSKRSALACAVRTKDDVTVILETVRPNSWEHQMGTLFFAPPHADHPRNPCIPIYEVLQNPKHPEYVVLAMPSLYGFDDVPFETVGKVVDCIRQLIEVYLSP